MRQVHRLKGKPERPPGYHFVKKLKDGKRIFYFTSQTYKYSIYILRDARDLVDLKYAKTMEELENE